MPCSSYHGATQHREAVAQYIRGIYKTAVLYSTARAKALRVMLDMCAGTGPEQVVHAVPTAGPCCNFDQWDRPISQDYKPPPILPHPLPPQMLQKFTRTHPELTSTNKQVIQNTWRWTPQGHLPAFMEHHPLKPNFVSHCHPPLSPTLKMHPSDISTTTDFEPLPGSEHQTSVPSILSVQA